MARVHMTEAETARDAADRRPDPGPSTAARLRHAFVRAGGEGRWRRGLLLALFSVLTALLMALHSRVPNRIGNLGSLVETFLPWAGLAIPLLLLAALLRRSATALVALLLPALVWADMFGGLVTDKRGAGGDLTVATHNVNADNPDPAGTARQLARSGAEVLALQELPGRSVGEYRKVLAEAYPYHTVQGTVGLWSKYPIEDARPVDIGIGWTRAMRATVTTPGGDVAVYGAHLPSVRVKFEAGFTARQRDVASDLLGEAIAAEPVGRVVLLGDLNGTMNDRALASVTSQMRSTQGAAGDGFGFSWPASFPMARIDQIMVKGVEPVSSWTLSPTASDHLPLAASVSW
ncbi:endonuclease/exonuclease/phosphatase family protein [Streptomyces sp. CNQ085]|uniref:endonuclease/exonuclease/phosphatase family protein n=1 Tax=Streptomyces sp. CNQ085 TaxID=2886944 RepID=UPI001F50E320|nr:endonuclease/exonuclease/phosphatase family protein [Streptomyces sp. CNQ085]MCI0387076.1 endonuclease/exonuclease/phosphatase family protein [Streptomyces sp. CNQ085]